MSRRVRVLLDSNANCGLKLIAMQRRRRKCVGARPPAARHFVKAILPSPIHENQLRIPDEFITRFGMEISSDDATITVPDGRTWKMGLKKCGGGGEVYFCNNWQQFAKYYCIGYGCYLAFKYEGNSKFSVVIFDSTSTEISYPPNPDPDADLASSSSMSKSAPSERAHAAANAFKPNNPYFVSILKPDRLYVPSDFGSKFLKPKVPLKIQNSNGDKWQVYCVLNYVGTGSMRITRGLAKFARENDMSEGDTCVFELIKRRHPVVLQVTTFRAVDYVN